MSHWADKEIQFLKENRQNMTTRDLAIAMKRTYSSIEKQAERLGLRKETKSSFSTPNKKEEKNAMIIQLGNQIVNTFKPYHLFEKKSEKTSVSQKKEEISILDLSDVHVGMRNTIYDSNLEKSIVTYNEEIFLKQLVNLKTSIFQIYDILKNSYQLRTLKINVMGDIITNDRIFPEQSMEIDYPVGEQIWKAIPIFTEFFNSLLEKYEKIDIICVVGNHGRSMPDFFNEPVCNNFEYFIYKTWQKQFENSKRIRVIVPDSRRHVYNIYNWKHLIEHGDSFRGATASTLERQIEQLYVNVGGFDVFHMGHVHKCKESEITDKVICKINGGWIPKDSWAFKTFKTYSLPKQHFFGCNTHRPETWGYKLDLRG